MDVVPTGSHALSGRSDFITRIDFDGDFNAGNNWENAASAGASFAAHAYDSLVATSRHWFIAYPFFHPRVPLSVRVRDAASALRPRAGTLPRQVAAASWLFTRSKSEIVVVRRVRVGGMPTAHGGPAGGLPWRI
jgi:hypothetical protein